MPFEVTIEKLTPGGDGFSRLPDGRAVFVEGALPGDVVCIETLRELQRHAHAVEWSLRHPSLDRRVAPCSIAERCGGCDWMALPESRQREAKLALLQEALTRTGRFFELSVNPSFVSADSTLGYRGRVRLHLEDDKVGFFARGSHELVEVSRCLVASEALQGAVDELTSVFRKRPSAFARYSEVEVSAHGDVCSLVFKERAPSVPSGRRSRPSSPAENDVRKLLPGFVIRTRSSSRRKRGDGGGGGSRRPVERIRLPLVDGVHLLAAPGDFIQVNWDVNRKIVTELVNGAKARGLASFLDLFCGVGNLTLPLVRAELRGVAVDSASSSVRSAEQAALEQGLGGVRFECRDVMRSPERFAAGLDPVDLLVLNPPRSGVPRGLQELSKLARRAVFLCFCDPVTFARDLRRLVDDGFVVETITAYDMFPQTHHFEVTAWLRRADPG